MSQTETPKAEGAEERTEEARSFVRRVRTATRSKYTPEEKIRIVLEGFRRGVTVRQHNKAVVGHVSSTVEGVARVGTEGALPAIARLVQSTATQMGSGVKAEAGRRDSDSEHRHHS